jgi:hypothetical protein
LDISPYQDYFKREYFKQHDTILDFTNYQVFKSKFFFNDYADDSLPLIFTNYQESNHYIIFSKPIKNILISELYYGKCGDEKTQPFLETGTWTKYMFIFDSIGNIKEVHAGRFQR